MKKLNTIIAASLLAVTAGVASAGCTFTTNTPGEMFLYPGIKTDHGTGIWKTTQGATVSLTTRDVDNIILTQARKNFNSFNKQQPAYGHIWREGNYTDTEFAYEAKYDYSALDATGRSTTISVTELNGDPISSHSPWQNWNSTSGGTEKTKIEIGNIHGGAGAKKSFKVEFDIRGTAAMVGNPMMPQGNYVATHEIWCIK